MKSIAIFRPALRFACAAFPVWVIAFWLTLRLGGERFPATAFCLYLPPLIWLVPGGVLSLLTPWVGKAGRVAVVVGVVCSLRLLAGGPMLAVPRRVSPGAVVVVTNNYGQSGGTRLWPFVLSSKASLLFLQDGGLFLTEEKLAAETEGWHVRRDGSMVFPSSGCRWGAFGVAGVWAVASADRSG